MTQFYSVFWVIITLVLITQRGSSDMTELKCEKVDIVESLGLLDVKCYSVTTSTNSTDSACNPLDGINFQCKSYGRFPDTSVPNCKGYIFCVARDNGTFILNRYQCPEGSSFNDATKICTTNYICPCDNSTSETTTLNYADSTAVTFENTTLIDVTTAENLQTTTIVSTPDPIIDQTTENPNTEFPTKNETILTTTTSTTTTESIKICNPLYGVNFQCTDYGRFLDESVTNCKGYIFCVTQGNGEFVLTRYQCPEGTIFNNVTKMCTANYYCPCDSPITETTVTTSSTEITTADTTTENPKVTTETMSISDITAAYTTTVNPTVTTVITSSTEITAVNTITENPTGTEETTSSTEITAANTTTGNQTVTIVTTSSAEITTLNTTTENPTVTAETASGTEITAGNTATGNPTVTTETSSITEITASNRSTGIPIMTTETTSSTEITTVNTTTENPTMATVSIPDTTHNQTTENPNTESTVCNVSNGFNFQCIENGSFADESTVNCTGYIICTSLHDGKFNLSRHQCSNNTYFNNNEKICTANNTCPCVSAATTPSIDEITSNTVSTPTENACNPLDGINFQCIDYGRFLDESVPNCKGYIFCVTQGNGVFILTRYNCPEGTIFNNMTKMCTANYTCPCDSSNSVTTTLNYNNGTDGTVVNATLDLTTENPPVTTVISTPDTINDLTTEYQNTASASNSTSIPTDTTSLTITTAIIELTSTTIDSILSTFKCNASGRYEDESDSNCSGYIYCMLLENDTYALSRYTCPIGTHFNPDTSMCARTYVCPSTSNSSLAPSIEATSVSSTVSTSTPSPESVTIPSSVCNTTFECQTTGRFPDYSVSGCKNYIYCVETNGIMETMIYTCPSVYVFDAKRRLCAIPTTYTCPC